VAEALAPWCVSTVRPTAPMTVLPAAALPTAAATLQRSNFRPVLTSHTSPFLARRIDRAANWLTIGGCFNGIGAIPMLFIAHGIAFFGALAIVLVPLILIGATKMKARQSYRWSLLAAYLALVPTSFCFPLTVLCGLRAIWCLNEAQVRAAFPT
jgi:hypothetical protein